MSDMTPTGLLAAVRANPSVAWALLTDPPQIVGPWEREEGGSTRRGPPPTAACECGAAQPGVRVSRVTITSDGYRCEAGHTRCGPGPRCSICGEPMTVVPAVYEWGVTDIPVEAPWLLNISGYFRADTREAAESWCDARLRAAGVLLAEGTP